MTDKNLTHIDFILDRSGSMASCREATEEGFNGFIAEQKKQPGRCVVGLHQFDNEYQTVYSGRPIDEVPALYLQPRGSTALLDAIGRTINEKGKQLDALPESERPAAVLVVILTDGGENSSREFGYDTIQKMITEQTDKYQWMFKFIGANQDAIANGAKIGIDYRNSMNYDTANTHQVFSSLNTTTSLYRGSVAAGATHEATLDSAAFTEADRIAAVK